MVVYKIYDRIKQAGHETLGISPHIAIVPAWLIVDHLNMRWYYSYIHQNICTWHMYSYMRTMIVMMILMQTVMTHDLARTGTNQSILFIKLLKYCYS